MYVCSYVAKSNIGMGKHILCQATSKEQNSYLNIFVISVSALQKEQHENIRIEKIPFTVIEWIRESQSIFMSISGIKQCAWVFICLQEFSGVVSERARFCWTVWDLRALWRLVAD